MVTKSEKDGLVVYKCDECGFSYKDEAIAGQCEEWCKIHKSCNIEITKNAI
jgi:predicted Zn-ribbon and HTH transcriptional regulator